MDPLLRRLQSQSIGISVNSTYAGGYLHADDIRTLASSSTTLEAQISMVTQFTEDNFLTLNASKCEIVVFDKAPTRTREESLGNVIPVKETAKCLGYLWKQNLSSLPMIEDRIQKARKAYFQFGSIYAFQGSLSPVSTCSIVQWCVLPILLYGVENWIMSDESIKKLECFQGEIAKRILQMPKWYSNKVACTALGWNSIHSLCTIRKLRFLLRAKTNEESICYRTFSAMVDNIEGLCLVRECREMEQRYKSNFTTQILDAIEHHEGKCILKEAEEFITQKDQELSLAEVSKYHHIHRISTEVGWRRLWDHAIDYGLPVVKSIKNLLRVMAHPDHAKQKCPLCDLDELDQNLPEHFMRNHTNSDGTWDTLFDSLITMDPSFYSHILCFLNVF